MVELSTCTICKILYLQMYFNGLVQIWANLGRGVVPYALHLGVNCLWVSLEKQNKKTLKIKESVRNLKPLWVQFCISYLIYEREVISYNMWWGSSPWEPHIALWYCNERWRYGREETWISFLLHRKCFSEIKYSSLPPLSNCFVVFHVGLFLPKHFSSLNRLCQVLSLQAVL